MDERSRRVASVQRNLSRWLLGELDAELLRALAADLTMMSWHVQDAAAQSIPRCGRAVPIFVMGPDGYAKPMWEAVCARGLGHPGDCSQAALE